MTKRFVMLALVLLCVVYQAPAASAVDLTGKGSLTIQMKHGNKLLYGIEISICRVADAVEDNGTVAYNLTEEFKKSSADLSVLTGPGSVEAAAGLDKFANDNNVQRYSQVTDREGETVFSGLSAGVYLVAQVNASSADYAMTPFLVPLPFYDTDLSGWSYVITAYPKTEPTPPPTEPTEPATEPTRPSTFTTIPRTETGFSSSTTLPLATSPEEFSDLVNPTIPEGAEVVEITPPLGGLETLPDTGLLRWPVPVMYISGVLMLMIGLTAIRKDKTEEAA